MKQFSVIITWHLLLLVFQAERLIHATGSGSLAQAFILDSMNVLEQAVLVVCIPNTTRELTFQAEN